MKFKTLLTTTDVCIQILPIFTLTFNYIKLKCSEKKLDSSVFVFPISKKIGIVINFHFFCMCAFVFFIRAIEFHLAFENWHSYLYGKGVTL